MRRSTRNVQISSNFCQQNVTNQKNLFRVISNDDRFINKLRSLECKKRIPFVHIEIETNEKVWKQLLTEKKKRFLLVSMISVRDASRHHSARSIPQWEEQFSRFLYVLWLIECFLSTSIKIDDKSKLSSRKEIKPTLFFV